MDPKPLKLAETLCYEEKPIQVLDTNVHITRRKDINMIKVLWPNHKTQEVTLETENSMHEKYTYLFPQVSKL